MGYTYTSQPHRRERTAGALLTAAAWTVTIGALLLTLTLPIAYTGATTVAPVTGILGTVTVVVALATVLISAIIDD